MTASDEHVWVDADEFDLDLAWGELDPHGGLDLYSPTTREIPGETCDTNNATCRATCLPNHPCPTQAQTHCFTCRC